MDTAGKGIHSSMTDGVIVVTESPGTDPSRTRIYIPQIRSR